MKRMADFRDLCAKLHLKAESQEIDRIIEAFSARFYECNPTTVFGSPGVVHTVTAAMLMLNTDLHIAELSKHMSRADFIRNAMRAIQESASDLDIDSTPDLVRDDSDSLRQGTIIPTSTRSRPVLGAAPTARSASAPVVSPLPPTTRDSDRSVSTASVAMDRSRASTSGSIMLTKAWEVEAENALKVSLLHLLC
jgi:PH/SEC7 domain-containing protein